VVDVDQWVRAEHFLYCIRRIINFIYLISDLDITELM